MDNFSFEQTAYFILLVAFLLWLMRFPFLSNKEGLEEIRRYLEESNRELLDEILDKPGKKPLKIWARTYQQRDINDPRLLDLCKTYIEPTRKHGILLFGFLGGIFLLQFIEMFELIFRMVKDLVNGS